MKYDDASWHSGGDFPSESPEEYGGTHIALFLRWCFSNGWAGQLLLEEAGEDVQRVIDGRLAATEFLFRYCDGKLTDEDLNEEGCRFANKYYGEDGLYFEDYAGLFHEQMYLQPEAEHDFPRLSAVITTRFESGILTVKDQAATKPWWKFW